MFPRITNIQFQSNCTSIADDNSQFKKVIEPDRTGTFGNTFASAGPGSSIAKFGIGLVNTSLVSTALINFGVSQVSTEFLPTEDFTFECFYSNGNSSKSSGIAIVNDEWRFTNSLSFGLQVTAPKPSANLILNSSVGTYIQDDGISHHVVFQREGNIWSLYKDGFRLAQQTVSAYPVSVTEGRITFGNLPGSNFKTEGVTDAIRIVKGEAVYTGSPPTIEVPFSYYTSITDVDFSNVIFSSNCTSVNDDDSQFSRTILIGNTNNTFASAGPGSSIAKFGIGLVNTSLVSTALINFGVSQVSTEFLPTEDFTFECFYSNGNSSTGAQIATVPGDWNFNNEVALGLRLTVFGQGGNPFLPTSVGTFIQDDGISHHVAFQREGNIWSLYKDGLRIAQTSANYTNLIKAPSLLQLNNNVNSNTTSEGVVDAVRIVKGEAVYSGSPLTITVPTRYYFPLGIPVTSKTVFVQFG